MTAKELSQTELETLSEAELAELYTVIKQLMQAQRHAKPPSFMARLKRIQIEVPEDFAANLELDVSGERRVEPDVH
jgi:hypothetical protein